MSSGAEPTVACLVIGDEILSGKFRDANAPVVIDGLRKLGARLVRIETLPDDVDVIADAVRRASAACDHVITSGGVGPTHDDVTMAGIARAFDVPLVEHPGLASMLRGFYQDALTDDHLRMAMVPEGTDLVTGDHPSWPVIVVRNLFILPGIPSLFRAKFDSLHEQLRGTPWFARRLYVTVDEGTVARAMRQVAQAHPAVGIGSYPRFDTSAYKVLVTLESKDEASVETARAALVAALGPAVLTQPGSGRDQLGEEP